MCNLSEGIERKGIAQGVVQGILCSLKSLIKNTGWTTEQAMDALEIPEGERRTYMDRLKEERRIM